VTRLHHHRDVVVSGTSSWLPPERVSTDALFRDDAELAAQMLALTGVEHRHVAPPDAATSDLVTAALRPLVDHAYGGVDALLVATVTPDHPSPATAPLVAHHLGLTPIPAFDLSAACAGGVYALDLAARLVTTHDRHVLVGAGECRFRTLDRAPPGVRVLFGDGAGALLVSRADASPTSDTRLRVVATSLSADGAGHAAIRVPAGGSRQPTTAATVEAGLHALAMEDGAHVFFKAVDGFTTLGADFLTALGLKPDDIDLVVPHQPNLRILERVARRLRIPLDRFQLEVPHIGNIGGASALIALDRAIRSGRVTRGARILLLTAGAGYTGAAALLEALEVP
jgi:3-oxoacyl-[acyl-carrier-protein] synthase-3